MGKNIVIGVTGSIAAYKSAEIVRKFVKKDFTVRVVMTESATEFITPLTLETLSGNTVYLDMFIRENMQENHISLADFADIILVSPATASIIGKVASGICDDLMTCTIFAFKGPVVFAPAMNENMWLNKIVQKNVEKLKENGYKFVGPEEGELASGKSGIGRFTGTDKIFSFVEKILVETGK
jgi:phosphopantothenoylcysteine synthetase/decarboxylase